MSAHKVKTYVALFLAAALFMLPLSGCKKPAKAETISPSPAPAASQPQPSVSPQPQPANSPQATASAAPESPSPAPDTSPDRFVELDKAELKKLEAELNERYAPFFSCTYISPIEVDWNEVLYGGGPLGSELTESELHALEDVMEHKASGKTVKVLRNDVERYVKQTTGTDYYDAWLPLRWYYMMDSDSFCCEYVPRERKTVELISAQTNGSEYTVSYNGINCAGESELFNASFEKSEDGFIFSGNWPAGRAGGEFPGSYGIILRNYVSAMTNADMYEELTGRGGVSKLVSLFENHAQPLDKVGARMMDLNGDSAYELIIGPADEEFGGEYIFQIYVNVDEHNTGVRPQCVYSSPFLTAARLDEDGNIVESIQENLFSASKRLLKLDKDTKQIVVLEELTMSWDRKDYTCFRYTPEGGKVPISFAEFENTTLGAERIIPEVIPFSQLKQDNMLC